MKKLIKNSKYALIAAVGLTCVASSPALAADLMGASVDANRKEILTVIEEKDALVLLGASDAGFKTNKDARAQGRVIIVRHDGRATTQYSAFRDRNGVSVERARDGLDKIVFLNDRGQIVGGSGLDEREIDNVTMAHDLHDAEALLPLLERSTQASVYRAVEMAEAELSRSHADEDTRRQVTADYLYMYGANGSTDQLASAIDRSQAHHDVAMSSGVTAMFERSHSNNSIVVADWVATEPDNGGGMGPGYIATEPDNGGGMGPGYIATEPDNGGGMGPGYIATEPDNGGGMGPGIVSQWQSSDLTLSIPAMNLDAHTKGTFLLISHYF